MHPWVAFFVLPLFAFVNTGVELENIEPYMFLQPLSLGIIFGLFLGKQLGIFGVVWVLVRNKVAKLPEDTTMLQMYGVSIICGVGFTMSLFIGYLAFESGGPEYNEIMKAAVFAGSLLSFVFGYVVLLISSRFK